MSIPGVSLQLNSSFLQASPHGTARAELSSSSWQIPTAPSPPPVGFLACSVPLSNPQSALRWGLAQHQAIQTAFKQVPFQVLWVSPCTASTLIIVAFPDCLDKGFLELMGSTVSLKMGTHLIDTALKGKLIHLGSPAQAKLLPHDLSSPAHSERQDGCSKGPVSTLKVLQPIVTNSCPSLFLWLQY